MMIIQQNMPLVKYVQGEIDKFLTILPFVLNFCICRKLSRERVGRLCRPLSLLCFALLCYAMLCSVSISDPLRIRNSANAGRPNLKFLDNHTINE